MTGLSIPDFTPDTSTEAAAILYASAGWYVLPIDPTNKNAGSVLGKGWPTKSSRDPKQIYAWFAGRSDGLALHVGRSGAVVFDVDDPDTLPLELSDHLYSMDPPHQSSRPDVVGRGHYLFAAPPGRDFSNGAGKLRGSWGEVRGRNGIIVVFPTPHSKGGRYTWLVTGVLPELPAELAEMLPDATDADAAATDAETSAFLVGLTGGDRIDLADKLFDEINKQYSAGVSRHQTFVDVVSWAMREAHAGLYPALVAAEQLRQRFVAVMGVTRDGKERTMGAGSASAEYAGILAWAVAQAKQSDPAEVRAGLNGRLNPSPLAPLVPLTLTSQRVSLTSASAFRPARVRWGWAERMPVGELTLIPGREGIGKSLFLAWMAAQLTKGTLPGEFAGEPRAVLYVASEDSWNYTITPRLIAAGADTDMVYRVSPEGEGGKLSLPGDCAPIAEAALSVHAAALMLDPIISLIDERLSVNQGRDLRQALEPLRNVAEATGIMINALAHFNKAADTDVLSKIPGARAWAEVARAAFGMAADTDEDDLFVASQIKNNLGRLNLPHLSYAIEEVPIVTDDGPIMVARLVWTGETDRGVAEVLAPRKRDTGARSTSELSRSIVAYVQDQDTAVAAATVRAAFPLIKENTVRRTLKRAAERGELSNPLHGHYAPLRRDSDTS